MKSSVRLDFDQISKSDAFMHEVALEKMEERGVFNDDGVDDLRVE